MSMRNGTISPPESFDYSSIAAGHYDAVFHRRRGIQSKWHHLKFAGVRDELPSFGNHLDIACGPGTFIATLPPTLRSVGLDIAADQITFARQRYANEHREFHTIEPGNVPYPDQTFDVVTIIELIEHLSDDAAKRLLSESRRVLKQNGTIVVTTPNYRSLWPLLEWWVNRLSPVSYEDQHISKYSRRSLTALMMEVGFTDVRTNGLLLMAPFAALFGWAFADVVSSWERGVARRFGHLLLARGMK